MIPARFAEQTETRGYDYLKPLQSVWHVNTEEDLEALVERLWALTHRGDPIALDYETDGVNPKEDTPAGKGWVVSAQMSWLDDDSTEPTRVFVDARNPSVMKALKPWLEDDTPVKVIHNYSWEAHISLNHGVKLQGLLADTLQLSRLEDAERPSHTLDGKLGLCALQLRIPPELRPTTKQALGTFKIKKNGEPGKAVELRPMGEIIADEDSLPYLMVYATNDVVDTLLLYHHFREKMEALEWDGDPRGLWGFYVDYHRPYQPILIDMERRGFAIDTEWAEYLLTLFEEKIEELDKKLWAWAGCEVNWNSVPQKQWCLYGERGTWENITASEIPILGHGLPIPPTKLGEDEDKISTDKFALSWILDQLERDTEDWQAIANLQERTRLKTLVKGTLNVLQQEQGKLRSRHQTGYRDFDEDNDWLYVHGTYNLLGARTGRLSCKNPNLQQVPSRSAEGSLIREAFTCEPGEVVLCGDYSQLELRILSYYLIVLFDDHSLADDLSSGDLHQQTADRLSAIMGYKIERGIAKNVNFGVIYGISKYKISSQTGMSLAEAQRLLDSYFETYPGIRRYMDWAKNFARRNGAARTVLGRYRPLRRINSRDGSARGKDERRAMNTPVQGSAQDIVQLAMLDLEKDELLKSYGYEMRMQVHDEIVAVCSAEHREAACARMSHLMMNAIPPEDFGGVVLPVDTHWGTTWAEAKEGALWPT